MAFHHKKIVGFGLLLLCAAGGAYYAWGPMESTAKKAELVTVQVERGDVEDVVTAQGTLQPRDYVDVGAQVSGQLKKLNVEIGSSVKKGDLIAEIDPQKYQSQLHADEANINSLKAQLEQQKAQADYDRLQYERSKKLVKTKAISEQDMEEKEKILHVSEATVVSIAAQIDQASANLETDNINLGYTKIYAPMDGIVTVKDAEEGETLNANQTTPTIVRVANLDVMTVSAQVAEADVMRLHDGMEAEFVTLGSDRKWTGKIRQILPTPETVNDVVLFDALIDVENKDRQLMNGMSTQDSFIIGRAANVLVVPTRALGLRVEAQDNEQKGKAYSVYVKAASGAAEQRTVFVGLATRSKVEVKSGLREGEQVIVSGDVETVKKKSSGPPAPPMGGL